MPKFNPLKPFGVVCHDAGGANQIVAILKKFGWRPTWVVMAGPAASIWNESFPDVPLAVDLFWFNQVHTVIVGTSCHSQLEYSAIFKARQLGCYSIAVLDHWVKYRERFSRANKEVLPDEIWVVDAYAEAKAKQSFPEILITRQADHYSQREIGQVIPIKNDTPNILLYLLEPLRTNWGKGDLQGEFQALNFFLEKMPGLGAPKGTEVHLRCHPSEPPSKYAKYLNECGDFPIRIAAGSLAQALSNCRWVVGCQTYAMTIALGARREVFGSLPPWAPQCALPHREIIHLRNGNAKLNIASSICSPILDQGLGLN